MSALPTIGEVSYNGFVFPVETETLSARITPVPDATGRAVKYTTFSFTILTRITGLNDTQMVLLRRKLTTYGAPFRYSAKGLGSFIINVGTAKDVAWGPKPQELNFKPLGGTAYELVWRVDVALPDCADAQFDGQPMERSYSVQFATDYAGYTTRTITGHIQVPAYRLADGVRVTDSVDKYWPDIIPPVPYGPWKRTFGPRTISPDRTRLDFSIIDTEQGENAMPPWVVAASGNHSLSTTNKGFGYWLNTINAEYELAKDAPEPLWPVKYFLTVLVKQRLDAASPNRGNEPPRPPNPAPGGAIAGPPLAPPVQPPPQLANVGNDDQKISAPIPVSFSMTEPEIYGHRKYALSISWTYACSLKDIFVYNGLWRPVDNDWRTWAATMASSVFHPRGSARMEFVAEDDRIVSLCKTQDDSGNMLTANQPIPRPSLLPKDIIASVFPAPSKDQSWLYYEQEIFIETDSGTVPVRLLPDEALTGDEDVFGSVPDIAGQVISNALGLAPLQSPGTSGGAAPGPNTNRLENNTTERAVRRVVPRVVVYLRGRAARVRWEIPAPRLTKIENMEPIPANRIDRGEGFSQHVASVSGVHPVWKATWNLRYELPQLPKKPIPLPPNPVLGGERNPQGDSTR